MLEIFGRETKLGEILILCLSLLCAKQPHEGTVGRQELGIRANCRLIIGAHPCHELCEAFLADGVSAAQADWGKGGRVVAIRTDRALEKVGPVWCLHGER